MSAMVIAAAPTPTEGSLSIMFRTVKTVSSSFRTAISYQHTKDMPAMFCMANSTK